MLVCVTIGVPSLVPASDEQAVQGSRRSALSTFQPSGSLFQTSVSSTFALAPPVPTRLRDLAPETESPRMKGLVAKMSWLNGRFTTETEVANSYGGTNWLETRMPGDTRMNRSTQMVRLGLTGTTGTIRYGLTYRNAGQAFLNGPDQACREMWGEWKRSGIVLRSAVGQLWNNVAEDASRPRLTQTYGRMSMGLARPTWPELTLTYARNSLSSMFEPLGITPQHTQSHTLEGAVAYQSLRWNVRLASSYALTSDMLRGGAESNVRMQLLTATFRPLNTFTISPMVGYRRRFRTCPACASTVLPRRWPCTINRASGS